MTQWQPTRDEVAALGADLEDQLGRRVTCELVAVGRLPMVELEIDGIAAPLLVMFSRDAVINCGRFATEVRWDEHAPFDHVKTAILRMAREGFHASRGPLWFVSSGFGPAPAGAGRVLTDWAGFRPPEH